MITLNKKKEMTSFFNFLKRVNILIQFKQDSKNLLTGNTDKPMTTFAQVNISQVEFICSHNGPWCFENLLIQKEDRFDIAQE